MPAQQYLIEIKLKRDEIPSFSQYPFCLYAIKNLHSLKFHPSVTFIIGENGSGKSTLLEAIAINLGFNPEGGSKNFNFNTYASYSNLYSYLRVSRGVKKPQDGYFLRAESFFNVATEIEKLDEEPSFGPPIKNSYGGKSLHDQSHGESFFALLLNRFRGDGLYMLDEPEAALSPTRQMAMISRLHQLTGQKSQFIIATHSPIIMSYPNATIYQLGEDGAKIVNYEDTENYQITRDFLNNYKRSLDILLDVAP